MSENIKHAKAPWTVEPPSEPDHEQGNHGKHYWPIRAAGTGVMISHGLVTISGHNPGMDERNARLIAAAPELLKALERLVSDVERGIHVELGGTPWVKGKLAEIGYARAAIAKATNDDKECSND